MRYTADRPLLNEALYRSLFDMAPTGILLMREDGVILDTNPAYTLTTQYTQKELIGQHISIIADPMRQETDVGRDIDEIIDGQTLDHIVSNRRKDGTTCFMRLREKRIDLQDGSFGVLSVAEDVTEQIKAEDEREKLRHQVQHAQKLESLGVLAGGVAHDFNNLLTGILGNVGLAEMEQLEKQQSPSPYLRDIESAAVTAADLCQQLLAYSGKGKFVVQTLDVNQLIHDMAHLLESSVSRKIRIKFLPGHSLPHVDADATQLRQVIMNLLINAADASSGGSGEIIIATCERHYSADMLSGCVSGSELEPGTYLEVAVTDKGSGMDEATIKRIFDPFFTTKFSGRGLGLAAVLGIIRGHNGGILINSTQGEGSVFRVLFPPSAAELIEPQPTKHYAMSQSFNGTALVVDDEKSVRTLARNILEKVGFSVRTAEDGVMALKIFAKYAEEIDLVLLDLTMPNMDGAKTLPALRKIDQKVKVILSSGYNEVETAEAFADSPFSAFLKKPYRAEELLALVHSLSGNTED